MKEADFIKNNDGTYFIHERKLNEEYIHKAEIKKAIEKVFMEDMRLRGYKDPKIDFLISDIRKELRL